ncbi:hypothetical protein MRX96_006499 [Rhipicephalus microplus]
MRIYWLEETFEKAHTRALLVTARMVASRATICRDADWVTHFSFAVALATGVAFEHLGIPFDTESRLSQWPFGRNYQSYYRPAAAGSNMAGSYPLGCQQRGTETLFSLAVRLLLSVRCATGVRQKEKRKMESAKASADILFESFGIAPSSRKKKKGFDGGNWSHRNLGRLKHLKALAVSTCSLWLYLSV